MESEKMKRLLSLHKQAQDNLRDIENNIDKIERMELTPILKKKYEGKYFVFDNGYNKEERWPLYIHVKKVESKFSIIADSFQTTTREFIFKINDGMTESVLGKRITKKQWDAAAKKFISRFPLLTKTKNKKR